MTAPTLPDEPKFLPNLRGIEHGQRSQKDNAYISHIDKLTSVATAAIELVKERDREVERLNAWADSFTDSHLKERQTGDALVKESLQRASAVESDCVRLRAVVEAAKWANWCPDAGGYKEGRSIESCYEELHTALCQHFKIAEDAVDSPNPIWMTEAELEAAIDAAKCKA